VYYYARFTIARFIFESTPRKRNECFKLKLNAYLAFKITFDKARLPLLPIRSLNFEHRF
jgi:hypothetical protein